MNNQRLQGVKSFKFLGLWFDILLTLKIYIDKVEVEDKCKKVLNIMRYLTATVWGADRVAIKNINIALVRSRLWMYSFWISC